MSWDVVLFNSREEISSPENIDEGNLVPEDFCVIFDSHFKNIVKSDNHRSIGGTNFTIEYFYDDEPTNNIMLSLYGESALYALIELAIKYGWQIFDTGLGAMVDLDDPSKNGYYNFQAYLNQILNYKD